jgi:pimeloyl-ACP methyl ester carboxylesterase
MRCVRIDLWGCGTSPPSPGGEQALDSFATTTLAALDSRNIERFAVVGLSMGGYLAFALWRQAPQRIRALVLCNTRASADTEVARDDRLAMAAQVEREDSVESIVEPMVARMLSPHAQAEAHIVDPVRGRIRRCTPAGIAFAQRAMAARPDSGMLLESIDVPSLVIAATRDAIIPTPEVRAMADAIPGAGYAELDCGHLSNLELPRAFNKRLAEFLVPTTMSS